MTTIPKDVTHWPQYSVYEGKIGRFVPDDLLKSRFAFEGEVKLTREEADRVFELIGNLSRSLNLDFSTSLSEEEHQEVAWAASKLLPTEENQ